MCWCAVLVAISTWCSALRLSSLIWSQTCLKTCVNACAGRSTSCKRWCMKQSWSTYRRRGRKTASVITMSGLSDACQMDISYVHPCAHQWRNNQRESTCEHGHGGRPRRNCKCLHLLMHACPCRSFGWLSFTDQTLNTCYPLWPLVFFAVE